MESPYSVNSPRRTLSLSKQRRATVSFFDADDKTSGVGLSGDHGPKPSEVYGFVGSITTVVATVIFLIWAYVPESWLQSAGISYYPSRYWALAIPTYVMVTIVLMVGFYIGLNFISTTSPASLNTVFGFSEEQKWRWKKKECVLRMKLWTIRFMEPSLSAILEKGVSMIPTNGGGRRRGVG